MFCRSHGHKRACVWVPRFDFQVGQSVTGFFPKVSLLSRWCDTFVSRKAWKVVGYVCHRTMRVREEVINPYLHTSVHYNISCVLG